MNCGRRAGAQDTGSRGVSALEGGRAAAGPAAAAAAHVGSPAAASCTGRACSRTADLQDADHQEEPAAALDVRPDRVLAATSGAGARDGSGDSSTWVPSVLQRAQAPPLAIQSCGAKMPLLCAQPRPSPHCRRRWAAPGSPGSRGSSRDFVAFGARLLVYGVHRGIHVEEHRDGDGQLGCAGRSSACHGAKCGVGTGRAAKGRQAKGRRGTAAPMQQQGSSHAPSSAPSVSAPPSTR